MSEAPVSTASQTSAAALNTATQSTGAAVVSSVVNSVNAHPDVSVSAAPGIIASILSGLYAEAPAIFAVSGASPKTQGTVGIGLDLLTILFGAFLKR